VDAELLVMTTTPYELILDRLDVTSRNGVKASARCPAHDDRTASLSVTEGDAGKVVVHCHAGCPIDEIVAAIGLNLTDLFPSSNGHTERRIAALYNYHNADGELAYQVVRYQPKDFRQRRPDGHGGWIWRLDDTPRILYNLPNLTTQTGTVFVTEGEKDADALTAAGYLATCGPGGAGTWNRIANHASDILADRDVIIIADKDPVGYKHARDVAHHLNNVAASITVVEAATGKDAADHLAAGLTVDDLLLVDLEQPPKPDNDKPDDDTRAGYLRSRLMTTEQIRELPPPAPLIDGLLYRDSLAVLYGASGIGKSLVAADLAQRVTVGGDWHSHAVTQGPVLYVVAEGVSGTGIRTDAWAAHHGVTGAVTWLPEAVNVFSAMWAEAMAEVVAELRPVLTVFDTFARCIVGADENSARDVGQAVANLDLIRRAAGSCVLVVHHAGKDKTAGARGSTALKGALDTELELNGGEGRMTLRNPKQKDAPEHPPIDLALRAVDGTQSVVVVPADAATTDLPGAVFATLQALRDIDVPGGSTTVAWRVTVDVPERTFYRHRSGLVQHRLVTNVGTDKQPRYRPTDALDDP
jgi:5S rRNA maturation endonuclease (ribonuclease M5)